MKRGKIAIALPLAVMTILAACSKDNSDSNGDSAGSSAAGSPSADQTSAASGGNGGTAGFTLGSKEIKFSYFANSDSPDTPWGSDAISKWIQDNKKVTIEYVPSNGAAQQRLNTMLVSGDLPDLTRLNKDQVEQFRQAGKLVPLDDYITPDSNVMKWIGDDILNMLRSEDGKLYYIPNWFVGAGDVYPGGNGGMLINRKIYSELGSPKLETTDDLEAYLRTVQQKYPDVVPLEMNVLEGRYGFSILYSSFAENRAPYFMEEMFYPDGDKLNNILDDPAFRDFAVYANRLYRDKLITQDAFTQNLDQVVEKVKANRVAVLMDENVFNGNDVANAELRKADPNAGYDMMMPVAAPGLDPGKIMNNSYDQVGINGAVITTKAKNPAEIYAYLDWVIGAEAQNVLTFGPPGVYWDKTDDTGAGLPNDNFLNSDNADQDKVGFWKHVILGNTNFVNASKVMRDNLLPEDKRDWVTKNQVAVAWKTAMNVTEFDNTTPSTTSDEGIIQQAVKDIFDAAFAKMMFAGSESEVDAIIAKAKSDMDSQGMQKLLDYKQKIWEANKQKLNLN